MRAGQKTGDIAQSNSVAAPSARKLILSYLKLCNHSNATLSNINAET